MDIDPSDRINNFSSQLESYDRPTYQSGDAWGYDVTSGESVNQLPRSNGLDQMSENHRARKVENFDKASGALAQAAGNAFIKGLSAFSEGLERNEVFENACAGFSCGNKMFQNLLSGQTSHPLLVQNCEEKLIEAGRGLLAASDQGKDAATNEAKDNQLPEKLEQAGAAFFDKFFDELFG